MNRIMMPGFHTIIFTTSHLLQRYYAFWQGLSVVNPNITIQEEDNNPQRCLGMLWRMKPLFDHAVELLFCRDADSVITYREALCNLYFDNSDMDFHAINDNDAHGGLMGGLVGFRSKAFIEKTGYKSFNQMVKGLDLKHHGSDQHFLNKVIHPKVKNGLLFHKLKGAGAPAAKTETTIARSLQIEKTLWVADLVSRYIGSAGVIDFELLRFFNSFDRNEKITNFEKLFPQIFYWQWKQ